MSLDKFLEEKSNFIKEKIKKWNNIEKIWRFCEIWTNRSIELEKNIITWKIYISLRVKKEK